MGHRATYLPYLKDRYTLLTSTLDCFHPGYTTFPISILVGSSMIANLLFTSESIRRMQALAYDTLSLAHLQPIELAQFIPQGGASLPSAPSYSTVSTTRLRFRFIPWPSHGHMGHRATWLPLHAYHSGTGEHRQRTQCTRCGTSARFFLRRK
jgi:hypothetical protein